MLEHLVLIIKLEYITFLQKTIQKQIMFVYNLGDLIDQNGVNLGYAPIYYSDCSSEGFNNFINLKPNLNTPSFLTLGIGYQQITLYQIQREQTSSHSQEIECTLQNERVTQQEILSNTHTVRQLVPAEQQEESSKRQVRKQKHIVKKNKKNPELKTLRPKKNVQSNISNQVFSYITNELKSLQATSRILKNNKDKIETYYTYIEYFTKNKKKYLSRKYLGDLCIFPLDREQCLEISKLKKLDILSLEQFRSVISYLIFHYLRNKCILNVLTSMKLSPELRRQHLERKRQILGYLEEYVRPDFKYSYR